MDSNKTKASDEPKAQRSADVSRRALCAGVGGAVVAFGLGGLKLIPSTSVVRPPGGQNEDLLLAGCNRCMKCYEVCPRGVIVPAHIEDGILTMRTPQMNFDEGYCDFCAQENNGVPLCVQVCPSQALKLDEGATAQTTIIGKAELNTDLCLAYNLIGCRYCYDACPYDAMELDSNKRPKVKTNLCNGCGACESVCVSLTEGSIAIGATERAIVIRPLSD